MLPTSTTRTARSLTVIATGICLCLCLLANHALGQTMVYWDNNGASAATSGTWDTTTPNWALTSTLTASTGTFTNNNFAIFAAGSTTISALTITVPGAVTCEGIGDGTTDAGGGSGAAVTALNFSGAGSINLPTGEWSFECGGSANNLYFNLPITGSGGIIQHNSGWLELYGNNTYSGGTWLTGGQVVQYNNNNAFGTGTITNSGGSTSILTTNASIVTLPNAFYMNGNYTFNFGSGNTTCTGPWYLATSFILKNNAATAAPLTLSGAISGAAGAGITLQCPSSSSATITLSGPNTFTGPTAIGVTGAATTLSVSSINSVTTPAPQASSSLGDPSSAANGTIAMGSSTYAADLIYTGAGETSDRVINLAGTTGGATIEMDGTGPLKLTSAFTATGAGAKTLTLQGSSTAANTIGGAIVNSTSATALTKAQAGNWTLSGVNTYTGATTVSAGTLLVDGSTASGSAVTVASGATLGGTGTINGTVSASAGAILSPGDPASANGIGTLTLANNSASSLTLNGNLIKCDLSDVANTSDTIAISGASGALVLNGANLITLSTPLGTAPAGTYTLLTYATHTGSGTLALDRAYPNATLTVGPTSVTLVVAAGGITSLTWQGDGSANAWDVTATGDWLNGGVAATYADGDAVLFDDTSANNTVNIDSGTVSPASVEVNTSVKNYTISGSAIGGSANLIKYGTSTLTLSGPNTYSGATTIAGGTVSAASINEVVGGSASSSLGAPTTVASGTIGIGAMTTAGKLVYTGSGETSDRVINLGGTTGGATIEMDGTGPLAFSSAFTATGGGAKTLTLQGTSTAANTIGGAIVDSSSATSLTKALAGSWTLSGVNTFTGGTTISGGTLFIGGAGQLKSGSYAGAIADNAAFVYNSSANQTLSGIISGTGSLSQFGSGNLTLSAVETYTGGTSNGVGSTLIIGGAGTITAAGNITNNGTLNYSSTAAETISGLIVGTGALNLNAPFGGITLTLSGANTYTGITTINGGVLSITSDANLGAVPGSPVANAITLNCGNNGTNGNNGLRIGGNMTLNANRGITLGSSSAAIQVAAGDTLTYNGIITGSGSLYMGPNYNTGSGTLILGGANSYSGSTTIACGTLQLGASGALPAGTPMIVATTTGGGILNLNNFSQTIGTLSSSAGIGGTGTTIPTIQLGTSGALTINQTSSSTFGGAITGGSSGGGVTLNAGSYALTLIGTNTYSCPTLINSGELIGLAGSSISNSAVTVSGGATNSISITNNATQWSCGGLTFSSGTSVLDFNFGSTVPSTTVAPLNVVGAANFTGTPIVTVEAGYFPFGSGTYPLMTWTSTSGTPPTTASLPPHVTGTLTISGNTLYLNVTDTQPLRWTGAAGNGLWDIATSQNWDDSTGTPTDYLQTTIPGDAVVLDETYVTAATAITLNTTVSPASVTVSNTIYNYAISGTGGIAGAIGVNKVGSGSLTLACANTYTGSTTNLGGTLIVGADANLGTAPGSAKVSSIVLSNATLSVTNTFTLNANRGITMLTNSTLDVAAGAQATYSGIIAGPANLTKTSPGTLVLGGNNNSYSGNTIIAAGVVQTGGDHTTFGTPSNLGVTPSSFAATNITLAGGTLQGNNADFSFNTNRGIVLLANSGLSALNGDIMGIPGAISGSFGLTISNLGTGIVFLTGTNTYTGSTLVSTGLLSLQAGGSISNSSLNIAAAAGFDVSKLSITSYAMGGSSFTASGHGTVTNIGTATAAVLNGAAGGSISLGSLPIFLTFTPAAFNGDLTHPSLYLTQGTLKLNGNSFTVTNASGSPLGAGTYVLIQQNGGSITSAGSYGVSVTGNGIVAGNTASISVSGTNVNLVVTWQPPTIANTPLTTNAPSGVSWKIALTNLASAAGWSDPESNSITVSSVGPASTNGVSVTTDGSYIYYNGPVTVADQFGYTITDGVLAASGIVNLVPVNQTGPSIATPATAVNGNPTFGGFGIPGYTYGVESTINLGSGPWIEAGNTTASAQDGAWSFTDLGQTNPPTIFYRLYYPDNPANPPQ